MFRRVGAQRIHATLSGGGGGIPGPGAIAAGMWLLRIWPESVGFQKRCTNPVKSLEF